MNEILTQHSFYYYGLIIWIIISIVTFMILVVFKPKTYGRHVRNDKFSINNKLGWFLMELPTVIFLPYFFFSGSSNYNLVTLFFISLYMIHYINRVFIFPLRLRTTGKNISLLIVFFAVTFNIFNTYFIGYYFGNFSHLYDIKWFYSPFFYWLFSIGVTLLF